MTPERHRGTLKYWNLERAFGFVLPDGGGPALFLHVSDTKLGSRDPAVGDKLTYESERTGQTWRARAVVFEGVAPVRSGRENRLDPCT
jgi:cold shock CspA family protein